jgi:hypothetical protein
MSSNPDRRAQLRRLYGFDFPPDLFAFWDFANRLRPLEPLAAFDDLGVALIGPFEVLWGRFDGRTPRLSQYLHWRYHDDPPELFTVLAGTDGLHWGYYLDDPAAAQGCVASYHAGEALEITPDGDTLFEALRLHLEMGYRDGLLDRDLGLDDGSELGAFDRVRARFPPDGTGDRPETGEEYEERYPAHSSREARVVAATRDGMGILVPRATYRPLSLRDGKLWQRLGREDDPADLVAEARQALRDGFPGTALKLGKDLWATGGECPSGYAYELLDAAYAALGRGVLREVLRAHRGHRDLPSVDILENEAEGEDG